MSLRDPPEQRLHHDALFYEDEDAVVEAGVPFVRAGLERGETVGLHTARRPVTALLQALFSGEPGFVLLDERVQRRPVALLDTCRRMLDRSAPAVRIFGHVDLDGALPWPEWVRYEAALEDAFARSPLRALCAFPLRGSGDEHPDELFGALRGAHRRLVSPTGPVPNQEYADPAELVTRPGCAPRPDRLQARAPALDLAPVEDLRGLRLDFYPLAIATHIARARVDDLVSAVEEVVGNAHRHGRPPVRVRVWPSAYKLVVSVTDQGDGIADPLLGYVRGRGDGSGGDGDRGGGGAGLGLWAARQLCDTVDYSQGPDGFTVRLVATDL